MDKLKKAWKSWTVWFNTLVAALIAFLPIIQDYLPTIGQYLSEGTYKSFGLAIVVVNLALRFKTTSSLADK